MNELSPVGFSAVIEAAQRWAALALLFVPTLALTIVALVLRVRIAARSAARLNADGSGPWLDRRRCLRGTISLATPRKRQTVARFRRRKKEGYPNTVSLLDEARVRLSDGAELRLPAGTAVHFELGTRGSIAEHKIVAREGSGNDEQQTVEVVVQDGADVWLVAHAAMPVADGAMRSSAAIELASSEGIELHFERPEPPETRFLGTTVLVWAALAAQVLFSFAEGWRVLLLLSQAVFIASALSSINSTRGYVRALDGAP
ncbi:MAG: hypothetical protein U0269_30920 [Polyangiales bacterium]